MKETILVFYPQMEKVVEFYLNSSPLYSGEAAVPWSKFQQSHLSGEKVTILGRHGNYHQLDLPHIRVLREKGVIPEAEDTTVVLFDWHPDLDNNPLEGTPLTSASWAYLGLEENLYSNLYIIGADPSGGYSGGYGDEMNPWKYEEELRPPTGEILRKMNRIFLYPAASSFSCLKFLPEYEHYLSDNDSVAEYFAVKEGGFVVVRFKGMKDVDYRRRRKAVVISVDLDVLKQSILKTVCPQGIMGVEELIEHFRKVRESGPIHAALFCGLTEDTESQDDWSLYALSRILSEASALLGRGDDPIETC